MTPHARTQVVAELIVNPEPGAILAPGAPGLLGRLPLGQIMRHQAPGTAGAEHILNAIEHLPQGVLAGATASVFRRQERLQDVPLLVRQIRCVGQA
jgi:hypothetical protein